MADQLLQGDEQSFESGIAPGRWEQFTWPCVFETCPGPGGSTCVTGVWHPTLIGACNEGPDGNPVDYLHHDDSPGGPWGTKCLGIWDSGDPGWGPWANVGGIMITLPVVPGATYTISGYVKFATGGVSETGWRSAGGISVDTDGGTDAGAVEYGYSYNGAIQAGDVLIGSPDPGDTGDAIWNQEGFDPGDDPTASNEEIWWGPTNFTLDIAPTGGQMTIFLWALNKFRSNIVLFDGISVDGPIPAPSAGLPEPEWSLYE
jgi:hypothetical protein